LPPDSPMADGDRARAPLQGTMMPAFSLNNSAGSLPDKAETRR